MKWKQPLFVPAKNQKIYFDTCSCSNNFKTTATNNSCTQRTELVFVAYRSGSSLFVSNLGTRATRPQRNLVSQGHRGTPVCLRRERRHGSMADAPNKDEVSTPTPGGAQRNDIFKINTVTPETLFGLDTSRRNFHGDPHSPVASDVSESSDSPKDVSHCRPSSMSSKETDQEANKQRPKARRKPRGRRPAVPNSEAKEPRQKKQRETQDIDQRNKSRQYADGLVDNESSSIPAQYSQQGQVPGVRRLASGSIQRDGSNNRSEKLKAAIGYGDKSPTLTLTPSPFAPEPRMDAHGYCLHRAQFVKDPLRDKIDYLKSDVATYLMQRPYGRACLSPLCAGYAKEAIKTCRCFSIFQDISKQIVPESFTNEGLFILDRFDSGLLELLDPWIRLMILIKQRKHELAFRQVMQRGVLMSPPIGTVKKDRYYISFPRRMRGKINALNGVKHCPSVTGELTGLRTCSNPDFLMTKKPHPHFWGYRDKLEQVLPFIEFHDSTMVAAQDTAYTKSLTAKRLEDDEWAYCMVQERKKTFALPGQSKSMSWRATFRLVASQVHKRQLVYHSILRAKLARGYAEMDEMPTAYQSLQEFIGCFGCLLMPHQYKRVYLQVHGHIKSQNENNKSFIIAASGLYYCPHDRHIEKLSRSDRLKWIKVPVEHHLVDWDDPYSGKGDGDTESDDFDANDARDARYAMFVDDWINKHKDLPFVDHHGSDMHDDLFPGHPLNRQDVIVVADEKGAIEDHYNWRRGIRNQLFATKGEVSWETDDFRTIHSFDFRVYPGPATPLVKFADSIIRMYGITPKDIMNREMERVNGNDNLFCLRKLFTVAEFCDAFGPNENASANDCVRSKFDGALCAAIGDQLGRSPAEMEAEYSKSAHCSVFLCLRMLVPDCTKKTMEALRTQLPQDFVQELQKEGYDILIGTLPLRPVGHVSRYQPLPMGKASAGETDAAKEARVGSLVHIDYNSFVLHSPEMVSADGFEVCTGIVPYVTIFVLTDKKGRINDELKDKIETIHSTPSCSYIHDGPLRGPRLDRTITAVDKVTRTQTTTTNKLNNGLTLPTVKCMGHTYKANRTQHEWLVDQGSHYISNFMGPALWFGNIEHIGRKPVQEARTDAQARFQYKDDSSGPRDERTERSSWKRCPACDAKPPTKKGRNSSEGKDDSDEDDSDEADPKDVTGALEYARLLRNITYPDSDYDTDSSSCSGAEKARKELAATWAKVDELDEKKKQTNIERAKSKRTNTNARRKA